MIKKNIQNYKSSFYLEIIISSNVDRCISNRFYLVLLTNNSSENLQENNVLNNIGNKAVFKSTFNKFYKELVIYAHNFLYDQQASEDLVQDVYIYLWENSEKIEIKTSIRAYLYKAVQNRCLNYLKSLKVEVDLDTINLNTYITTDYDLNILDNQDKLIIYNHVLKVVDQFPERMKQIFKLKYLQGYKYSEIAEELDVSINSVKTQLQRAKLKLNEAMVVILLLISNS
ncbi:RNA polymerase ECF-type sigma factor [Formosa agariphila KMM 3901]|uniref:RNA polymerase ECF-type sigma factor n=1 Tax=Formosa agariphila (strain DSM 15362 / KCTC 12365 / LMG 23005 / KMM 3901 / M-2Alg 35-1) TaxID=1347342 RepID=T2KJM8_FORAG|nr:RNA polymerase sigma-70 factor [Formosa agariphila]CDF78633.1 RNA polymerase ECF-type sigma factor [Formosa agariphila KMM 3901]